MLIETKYNIEDEVYFMYDNKITSGLINDFIYRKGSECKNGLYYSIKILNHRITGCDYTENELFTSKKELIDSL